MPLLQKLDESYCGRRNDASFHLFWQVMNGVAISACWGIKMVLIAFDIRDARMRLITDPVRY